MNNGIYGDSTEDRYYSQLLEQYLEDSSETETETIYECPYCGDVSYTNTQCCSEMHREEKEVEVEDDEEDTGY